MKPPSKTTNYDVGYGKPPEQTRFIAGRSGNPHGRPKKRSTGPLYDGTIDKLTGVVLEEAYREVEIVENGSKTRMPIVKAAVRSLALSAVRGEPKAQATLLRLVAASETYVMEASLEAMNAVIEYKDGWEWHKIRAQASGSTLMEPVPHPDDLVVDTVGRRILVNGPRDEHEKAEWDAAFEHLRNGREICEEIRELMDDARDDVRAQLQPLLRQHEIGVAVYEACYPNEATRRRPGFDLAAWREARRPELKQLVAELKRVRRRSGRPSKQTVCAATIV